MIIWMVLHVVKFINEFPCKGGVKLFSPGEIMTGRHLHADDFRLGFGTYCQVAEHVEPCKSLAPRTRVAIALGNSGNLSGGQMFLALDTGHTIVRHQWVVLPMPPAIIARVTVLGKSEPSILTFTDRHGCEIGDYPQDEPVVDDEGSENYDYVSDLHDSEFAGVGEVPLTEPTGVEVADLQNPKMTLKAPTRTQILGPNRNPEMTPVTMKPRAILPASQPRRRYLKTLYPHAKGWLPATPG
jgi:hypothetical protein